MKNGTFNLKKLLETYLIKRSNLNNFKNFINYFLKVFSFNKF